MVALRTRSLGAFSFAPFWLSTFCATLTPTAIGYQDLAAFFARQPGVSERWREHMIASPFGTIHAATFSFARPLGTDLPEPGVAQPVNFDPRSLDVKVWAVDEPPMARPALDVEYPTVNRRPGKGDRLPSSPPPASEAGKACRSCSRSTRRHRRRRCGRLRRAGAACHARRAPTRAMPHRQLRRRTRMPRWRRQARFRRWRRRRSRRPPQRW